MKNYLSSGSNTLMQLITTKFLETAPSSIHIPISIKKKSAGKLK